MTWQHNRYFQIGRRHLCQVNSGTEVRSIQRARTWKSSSVRSEQVLGPSSVSIEDRFTDTS